MVTVLFPIGIVGFIVGYYLLYFRRIKKAGGMAAAGQIYWREQFGLWPGERVVSSWVGSFYMGPLVPETMRSLGQQALDLFTGTTVRGAQVYFCFTDHQRLALAVEMNDGDRGPKSSIGMRYAYRPLQIFDAQQRAHLMLGREVWPTSPHVALSKRPTGTNFDGKKIVHELVVLTDPTGARRTLWVEEGWVPAMRAWCHGGGVAVDPKWVRA